MAILWITNRTSYPIILGIYILTSLFINGLVYIYSQSRDEFVQLIYKWTKLTPQLEQKDPLLLGKIYENTKQITT